MRCVLIVCERREGLVGRNNHQGASGRPMLGDVRRQEIASRLRAAGSVTVAEIEADFGVSPMTARRDLAALEAGGVARRTHGGAVLPSISAHEDSFASRLERESGAKAAIGQAVAGEVVEDECLFVGSSSTAYHVVQALLGRGVRASVITNSLPVMELV